MRTLSAQEQQVVKASGYAARLRVRVADGGGTLRDLTALDLAGGRDFTRSIRVQESVEEDFAQATFVVRRQLDKFWNLSPYVATSKLNLVSGSFSPLLATGRLCVVDAFMVPAEISPSSGDWHEVFRGRVGPIHEGQDDIQVLALGLSHELADRGRFLDTERQYGSGGGVAVETVMQQLINDANGAPFVASAAYTNRDRVHPITPNGYWYQAETTASAGAEPVWPTTVGNTVTSGAVTFRCMGAIPQLYTPVSPSWQIAPKYNQRREVCWAALQALVTQLGWSLRDKYDSGTSAWRLTLFEPQRTKTVPDFTWYPDTTDGTGAAVPSILELPSWQTGIEDITNVLEGKYGDRADLDAAGQPKLKALSRRDTTSIDAYGWRWMGLALKATDQIDTSAEMGRLLDALLPDMKDPFATHEVVLPLFWPVELGDLQRFGANGYSYTADQDLAVVAFVHEQGESGAPTTRLTCRGKPSGGFQRWRRYGFDVAALKPAPQLGPEAPTGVTVTKVQGGLSVTWTRATSGEAAKDFEVHLSTSSGFTPNSSTLQGVVDGTAKTLANLDPGTTYYVKVVPRDALKNPGVTSSEVSTGAGYTPPRAMTPAVPYESLPFNPSFEAQTDLASPPDTWSVTSGTWGTNVELETSSGVYSGRNAVKFTGASRRIRSQMFPVNPFTKVTAMAWAVWTSGSATHDFFIGIEWFDSAGASLGSPAGTTKTALNGGLVTEVGMFHHADAPGGANYAAVVVGSGASNNAGAVVVCDNVRAIVGHEQWTSVSGSVGFGTGWSAITDPGFRRDAAGQVWLRGLVSQGSSTANTTIFTLPAGFWPGSQRTFVLAYEGTGSVAIVHVNTSGTLVLFTTFALNKWISLSGISFLAEQ